ncbi:hypothetical protein CW304_30240 [Bacillus sp. UFRGS-B20]|nr:hypothetical protein CW304_30240 [Bacillus sp. UFRGS-B20]
MIGVHRSCLTLGLRHPTKQFAVQQKTRRGHFKNPRLLNHSHLRWVLSVKSADFTSSFLVAFPY